MSHFQATHVPWSGPTDLLQQGPMLPSNILPPFLSSSAGAAIKVCKIFYLIDVALKFRSNMLFVNMGWSRRMGLQFFYVVAHKPNPTKAAAHIESSAIKSL